MSEDGRNGIYLWAGSIAVFAYLWATLTFDFIPTIPDNWFATVMGAFLLVNLAEIARLLFKKLPFNRANVAND